MSYMEEFERYYRNWLQGFDNALLIQYEQSISAFIDSEFYDGFILVDEINVLYEIIRDECVRRVAKMVVHGT